MIDNWVIQNAEDVQVGVFFALLGLFTFVELVAPRRPGPMRRKERWTTNLMLTALNIVAIGLIPVTFFGAAIWAQSRGLGLLQWKELPLVVAIAGTLLARGFISFFTHFLMHKVPLLWRLHRVHHLDTELDVSTTVRFHPLELVAGTVIGVPFVVALGLEPWVLLVYEILDAAVTLFSHANIRLPAPVDRVLRYIIVTPDLHRVHHSSWQPETDSNFSAVFPVWDLVFGTFRTLTRAPHETMPLGLEEVRDQKTNRLGWLLGASLSNRSFSGGHQS